MPLSDLLALDLDATGGMRAAGLGGAGKGEEGGFLEALLETPALKEAGVDGSELKALLDVLGAKLGGDGLPLDSEGFPLAEGELSAKLEALMEALAGVGDGDAEQALEGVGLTGLADGEEAEAILHQREAAAERAEVLRALAELEEAGFSGKELVAALQERLVHLDEPAQEEEGGKQAEIQGGTVAGSLAALLLSGESAEAEGGRSNAMGEQIARELRIGGLLGSAVEGQMGATQQVAAQGQSPGGSGGERGAGGEALLQALQASGGAEEKGAARADFGALLAAAQQGGGARGMMQLAVQQPVGQQGFTPAVGERVVWMAREGVQQARLQLNPPGLGPLDIQVSVGEERTTVSITPHHPATREALAQDVDRLRQFLADQGQGEVDVHLSEGERDPRDGDANAEAGGGGEQLPGEAGEGGQEVADVLDPGRGLIDHYA
ncbi:MAG: flagellar hook-length control protein FliK [Halorhodospira sp.]